MANWLTETMRPRMRAGLISAIYIGLVIEAAPTANPQMIRKMTNWVRLLGTAVPMAETKNRTAERISTFLRPHRSLRVPASQAPSPHPRRVQLAAQPVSTGLSMEMGFHEADGPGDHGGVVAKEQSSQRGHQAQERHIEDAPLGLSRPVARAMPTKEALAGDNGSRKVASQFGQTVP